MCTSVLLKDKSDNVVCGRTLEFAGKGDVIFKGIPRNYVYDKIHTLDSGYTFKGEYAQLMMQDASPVTAIPLMNMEGFNEHGLSCQIFYFKKFAVYNYKAKEDWTEKDVDVYHIAAYLLAKCKNLDELEKTFENDLKGNIYAVENVTYHPMHFNFYDKTGRCLVIEPDKGDFIVKENPTKVLTNSPKLEYHMENLSQFTNLSPYERENDAKFVDGNGDLHTVISSGTGTIGLPGGELSHHRYVRAAYFQRTAILNENLKDTVSTAWTIINKFDVAYGAVRTKMDPKIYENENIRPYLTYENNNPNETIDVAIITTVSNLTELKMQYKDYRNHSIREIDFKSFDKDGKDVKMIRVRQDKVPYQTTVELA